jgi:hypothetical protein
MVATSGNRAFRGLATVFVLTFINLIGVVVTAAALGGLAPWTPWQFVGLFAVLEIAGGLANVISPNIWHLPIAELETNRHTPVKLAASTMLLPHWGGLARAGAGLLLLVAAAVHEGLSRASLGLIPLVLGASVAYVTASMVVARLGIARPDIDVVQMVVRWRQREKELSAISLGASALQSLLSIATIPIAKIFRPSILYQPELAPSPNALLVVVLTSLLLVGLAYATWAGRFAMNAPSVQQREADEHA